MHLFWCAVDFSGTVYLCLREGSEGKNDAMPSLCFVFCLLDGNAHHSTKHQLDVVTRNLF
jgi:hypothetical protein